MFCIFGLRRYNFHVSPIIHIAIAAAVTLAGFAFVPLAAQTVVATVSAGSQPTGIAVNPAANKVYVANSSSSNVTVIDGAANTTLTVSAGINPNAIAVNAVTGMVYVTNTGSNNITVINGSTNVTTTVTVGSQPKAVVVDEVTNQIYVANYGDKTVSVISGLTNAVVKTIVVGTNPVALVANPVTGHVYVANSGSASVTDIDEASNTVAGTITVGTSPIALAVNAVTDLVYAANSSSSNISVIDGKTDSLVTTVSVGSSPIAVSVNPVTNTIYIANQTSNTVSVINGASNAVTATITIANGPVALGVNSLTSQVYAVCNGAGGRVSVIDGTSNTVKATLTVGDGPSAVALNPVTNKAYVSSGAAGNVSVIDGTVNKVAATIAVGHDPLSIVVNPATNNIYVASNNDIADDGTTGYGYWISGATNTVTNFASSGSNLFQVLVNPVTNYVYLENQDSVAVFDNTNAQVATISTGFGVNAGMVLDPARNIGYVAYDLDPTLFIIDTLSNTVTDSIPLGVFPLYPRAIAFNPVTDTIYVLSSGVTPTSGPNTLSVINGLTKTVTAVVPVGFWPQGLDVNPVTNKIYVANNTDGNVYVIDGATNTLKTTVTVGTNPGAIVVNSTTNKIYVANFSSSSVSVIDGSSDTLSKNVTVGSGPQFLALDPVANLIYVSNAQSGTVSVIDGASDSVQSAYTVGTQPGAITVNPATGKGYVTDFSGKVYVLSPNVIQNVPFTTAITSVTDDQTLSTTNIFQTTNRSPSFTAAVTSAYTLSPVYSSVPAASDPAPTALYYAVDGASGSWSNATESTAMGTNPGSFNVTLSGLTIGLHTLYVYPAYGSEGTPANGSGSGNSPEIGNLTAYTFLVGPMSTKTTVVADTNPQAPGGSVTFTATVAPIAEGAPTLTGTVSFYDGTTLLGTGTLALVGGSYQAAYQTNSLSAGRHKIAAVYFGDANYLGSTSPILTEVIGQLTVTTLTVTAGSPAVPVTTVAAGAVVTLTSQVTVAGTTLTTGLVDFCDATAATCTDIHLLGTAQLTSAGTASIKLKPGIGSHSYKAVFVGTVATGDATSASDVSHLTVTGLFSTTTMISQSGSAGNYTLTATVVGVGGTMAPTPNVSFEDLSNASYVLATPALETGTAELSFTNSSNPATGTSPQIVAVGDFNGDGIPDLATANGGDNTVSILLGNGDGTFTLKSSPATGLSPYSIAVGDFNGDGIPDLATVNTDGNTVSILLGNGDGTFTAAASPATDSGPFSIAVGDFNGDGKADLAVANVASNTISILLGNGNGTFTAASPITVSSPFFVAVGDFNGDSIPDLVATNPNGGVLSILLGNGDGTFTAAASPSAGGVPYFVALGDFNGDGISDLAVANLGSNNITILLGQGDGTFALKSTLVTDNNPTSVVVGDFNGDGKVDLAVATNVGIQEVTVLQGNGDGIFTPLPNILTPNPQYIAVGDFNGDGISDFAVTNPASNTVTVQLSQLTETVSATATGISPVGTGTHQVVAVYPGDANYSGSTSAQTDLTAQQVTTTPTLSANPTSSNFGDSVTLSATLDPYTAQGHTTTGETVTFYYGSTNLGTEPLSSSGVATLSVSTLPAGTDDLHAVYGGDPNFIGSTSSPLSYVVAALAPAAASVSAITAPFGSTDGITVSASESGTAGDVTGGVVTFSVIPPATGSFSPASCTLTAAGACTTMYIPTGTLAVGIYIDDIKASFAAVGNYAATSSNSPLSIYAIDAATATVSSVTTPAGSVAGVTVTAIESGTAGVVTGGIVTFSVIAPATGSFSPATCTLSAAGTCTTTYTPTGTLAVGTYANDIKASFAAVGNYASTSGTNNLNISAVNATTATVSAVTTPYGSTTGVTVTAMESGSAGVVTGGVVTFSVTAPATGSFSPASCTLTAAGTCTTTYTPTGTLAAGTYANDINASFAAVGNYSATTGSNNLNISTVAPTTATVSAVTAPAGSTTGITVTASESGSAGATTGGIVTFSVIAPATGSFSPATCTLTAAGICTTTYTPTGTLAPGTYVNDIKASFAAVGNYAATSGNSNLNISAVNSVVAMVSAVTAPYGSTAGVTVTATESGSAGVVTGGVVTFTVTAPATGSFSPATCTLTVAGTCTTTYIPTGTLAAGTYTDDITANFAAVGNYVATSGSSNLNISAVGAVTATVSAVTAPAGSTTGVTVIATESGSAGVVTGGIVTFSVVAPATGSFSPATCTLTAAGTCTTTYTPTGILAAGVYANDISASFAAVGNYSAATANNTLSISAIAATTATVSAITATAGSTTGLTVTASESGSAGVVTGGVVTFNVTAPATGSFSPATCTLSAAGTCTTTYTPTGTLAAGTYVNDIKANFAAVGNYSATSGSSNLNILTGPITHFTVLAPTTATAGTAFNVTVTALDDYGNPITGYSGTVHFTSTDGAALLPADALLTDGAGTFPVTLKTSGSQTITATDTVTSTLTGISGTIVVSAGTATHFSVSAPSTATTNIPISLTVTALDANGNVVSNYTGTAHFTSTDAAATLPSNSTLTSGVGTFTATLKTPGSQTITATDTLTSSVTGTSGTITVSAGAVTHFTVTAPTTATAGTSFTVVVTALDVGGNTVTGYTGTVHFTSTDGAAILPANVTLTNGVGTFTPTLKTAGPQTITATDTATSSVTGTSGTITVSAGVATHFIVSAPPTATAGTSFSVSVTALDTYGNTTTSYAGTVHFTSTDGAAILPANVTLTNGVDTFTTTLKTAGPQTITATDTVTNSITGTSGTITVSAGAATHFTVSAPSTATAGTSFNVSVTALDNYGNITTGYAGTVHFISTDGAAVLPANVTLTNGVGSFPATLKTSGTQTITATDTVTSSTTGTSGPIAVSVGSATHFTVSAPTFAIAGTAISVTVTALDAYSNTVTNYTGTIHFTSTDGAATLPLDATLTNGVGIFPVTLKTSGARTVTATDTAMSSITGTSGTITVNAGAATHFGIVAPLTATANTGFTFSVTALDANDNIVIGYADTVHFSSTDGAATLPTNSVLSNGTGGFTATLQAGGPQTITATGVTTSSVTGSASINVTGVVPVITFAVPNHIYGDAPFAVSATSTSNGVLTYSVVSGPATIAGNIVTLTGAGTVMLQVSQPVAGNYAAATHTATFMVAKAMPVITWPAPASIPYGTALSATQLNATIAGVGGTALAGTTVYTPAAGTFLMPPTQTLSLLFTPTDTADYNTATATVTLTVTSGVLTLTANNATRVYGTANPAFTGTIMGQQNGDTFTETFSTTAVQLSPVASYPIVPSASGANLSDYTQNVQNGTLSITQAGTSATLTVGTVNAIAGQNNTFTATITSLTSGTPTGTVQYLDNGSLFGSAPLVAGQAILTSAALGVGNHTITILYSGDVNFLPNSASGSSSTITVTPPDFTFTTTSDTTVAMPFGNTASFTFHLAPLSGNYYQTVQFSYSGDLPLAAKVSFSPNTVAADAGPTDVTFSVITSKSLSLNHTSTEVGGTLLAFLVLPLAFSRRLRRSRKMLPRIAAFGVLLLLSAGAAIGLTGCGSGFADATYPITVTANSGGVIHTAVVTVHILHTPQ